MIVLTTLLAWAYLGGAITRYRYLRLRLDRIGATVEALLWLYDLGRMLAKHVNKLDDEERRDESK